GDYEVPIFQFKVPADRAQPFWEGVADGSLMGFNIPGFGAPTYIYTSSTSSLDHVRGHGRLLTHEIGHHVGLTHPFQGGRCLGDACERMVLFGGPGLYLSRAANSVDGIMTYANTNNDFSQFEIDTMRRFRTYDYLDVAGFVVTKIAASPRAASVDAALQAADLHAAAAIAAYQSWDYEHAVGEARDAYERVMAAAASINVQVSPQDWRVARKRVIDFNPEFRKLLNAVSEDANQGYAHRTMAEVSPTH
ncbi:MAG TPA: hypothetical protein VLB44_22665, partial [Kofleriaceae bacterium]|nr:hypothetical protein [Kofleriaceae bacterium]